MIGVEVREDIGIPISKCLIPRGGHLVHQFSKESQAEQKHISEQLQIIV